MLAKSQLLEPWYAFRLEVPVENLGRAMTDIQRMEGSFDPPESGGRGCCAHRFCTGGHHAQLPHGGGGLYPGPGDT